LAGAQYLANAFKDAGLTPGGDNGSYLQTFPMTVEELASTPIVELTRPGEDRSLALRDDFRPFYGGSAGPGDVSGPALFAGHGDDFTGLSVVGKVLFVVPNGSLRDIDERAMSAGALAVIVTTGEPTLLKSEGRPPDARALPLIEVSQAGAASLLDGSGHTREQLNSEIKAGGPLTTFPLAWNIHVSVSLRPPAQISAHNVVGFWPGASDASSTVIVGAHYEEIGPDPDGVVYPAANDNASGTAVLVELMRLLHKAGFKPHSNVVFVAWSGHEEGLLGSAFYVAHPRFPLSATSLYLNIDTVGQGAEAYLTAEASTSAARAFVDTAANLFSQQGQPLPVRTTQALGQGSDHATFESAGISSISLEWGGILADGRLHTLKDTAETVDPSKLKVAGELAASILQLTAG
jgi:hypothetical protein